MSCFSGSVRMAVEKLLARQKAGEPGVPQAGAKRLPMGSRDVDVYLSG